MLDEHKHVSKIMSADVNYVIIYKGDELTLWKKSGKAWNDYAEVEKLIPTNDERYSRLKEVAHIPVLITMQLKKLMKRRKNRHQVWAKLHSIAESIAIIESNMSALHKDDLGNQEIILSHSKKLLTLILSKPMTGIILQARLRNCIEHIKPALSYNKEVATKIQISGLAKLMDQWQAEHDITPLKTRVIIISPHGPRIGRIEMQYFTYWLQKNLKIKKVKNKWIFNIETFRSKIASLDCRKDIIEDYLLGSELNKILGKEVEGNWDALFADILKPYAKSAIRKMCLTSSRRVQPGVNRC